MFRGEIEGLIAIRNTKTVRAPRPIAISERNRTHQYFVEEYIPLSILDESSAKTLGSQLADMHLFNIQQKDASKGNSAIYLDFVLK